MGRRKSYTGPGPIPEDWNGFCGPNPPLHTPVIVLTHQPHEPLESPYARCSTVPEVRTRGQRRGVRVRQFLGAERVKEFHVVVVPIQV